MLRAKSYPKPDRHLENQPKPKMENQDNRRPKASRSQTPSRTANYESQNRKVHKSYGRMHEEESDEESEVEKMIIDDGPIRGPRSVTCSDSGEEVQR